MNRVLLIFIGAALAALLLHVGESSARLVGEPFPGFLVWDNGRISSLDGVDWTGRANEGRPERGRVVSINGHPFESGAQLFEVAAAQPEGAVLRYGLVASGAHSFVSIATERLTPERFFSSFGSNLFNAVAFIGLGLIGLLLRPHSRQAQSLGYATVSVGCLFLLVIDHASAYRLVPAYQVVSVVVPVALFGLATAFPFVRGTAGSRQAGLTALGVLAVAIFCLQNALFYRAPDAARWVTWLNDGLICAMVVYLLACLFSAALRAPEPGDRVRAGVALAAAVTGLIVPVLSALAFFLLGGRFSAVWTSFLLPLFPATMLFVILREDLVGAERVARLSVGYALATAVMAVSYAVLLVGLERVLDGEVFASAQLQFLSLILIAVSFHPLYRRIQDAIDRTFYRTDLDAGRMLERMSVLLAARVDEQAVNGIIEREVMSALAVDWVALEAADAGDDRGSVLEEPVVYHGELLGMLRVGPKTLGAPFSEHESDLIVGVASQAAAAIHNARSIRDLRHTQRQLVEAERLAAIGEVAGAVAHGLRNPLAGIRAAAQMAQELDDPEELDEALGDLIQGTDRLDARVRRLLDFARMLEPGLAEVDVAALIEDVRATLSAKASQAGVDLRVEVEDGLSVLADFEQLAEALIELASNALRATRGGGWVELFAHRDGPDVLIRVEDNGCGIPEQVQARIFDLFFTTHETGTGMGLATVRKMLERQGGSIQLVESSPAGTAFRATLRPA
jgi:signal transduction histidine kinase